ncbi:hypothetical protein N799_10355 [Lysobacter arseniciresistens ZS79]|uniref:Uncharacterized protein n=1 Tax=Lysobacter arseniciresistens ZS79 TaxID=913325 RepID=A0A0A0F4C6_9GAMM|nr:hypothetical protein N799_10355 [Lysobacter arseniciresistens ZS79]
MCWKALAGMTPSRAMKVWTCCGAGMVRMFSKAAELLTHFTEVLVMTSSEVARARMFWKVVTATTSTVMR